MIGSVGARFSRACIAVAARCRERFSIGRFLQEVSGGATAIVAGAVTIMVLGASALIVDHTWLVDQRDVLKSASDAAAVAATIELKRLPPETSDTAGKETLQRVAKNYVTLNLTHLPQARLTRAKETLTVAVTPNRAASTVDVAASADLGGTLFTRHLPLAGSSTGPATITVAAKVESLTVPIEVILAIDVSESMERTLSGGHASWDPDTHPTGTKSRMQIVKDAASQLVAILDPTADSQVAIGVVPWQIAVRLSETARQSWDTNGWAEYPKSRHYDGIYDCWPHPCTVTASDDTLPADPGEDWKGCLDEHRVDVQDHADLPADADLLNLPSDTPFAQSIFPSVGGVGYDCLEPPLPSDFNYQSCYGKDSHDSNSVYDEQPAQRWCSDDMAFMLPLTSDRAAIDAAIDSLKPVGYRTHSSLGVLWGQRLLMHEWKAVWGDAVHPVNPTTGVNMGTRKAIVLLTDGEDNPCGLFDPFCESNSVGLVRSTACDAAKAKGTEIFVVAAMDPDNVSGDLATSLTACSSQANATAGTHAFLNNSSAESLEAAFATIAEQLRVYRRIH